MNIKKNTLIIILIAVIVIIVIVVLFLNSGDGTMMNDGVNRMMN